MNIAIDVSQMCYEGTGVARYLSGLTQALLSAGSPHHFTLYAGTLRQRSFFTKLKLQKPWSTAAWKIFPLPPKLAGFALNETPIPFELLTGPVDLIHTSDWSEPYSKLPKVTTVHDLVFKIYPDTVDPLIRATQTKRLSWLVQNQTHIIVDSESTKNDLMKIYSLAPSRISVVYPGNDARYVQASQTEIDRVKTKYHLPNKFILSLGTQEPRKNLPRLEEAVKGLDLPLIIVGKHGWGERTNSLGFVPEADLPALYSASAVFAYPSLYEGFGFPVLEAMACGTPVVTGNISSLPEVAGGAAVLVDPRDVAAIKAGIELALANRAKIVASGLKQAQKFTWGKTAQGVLEVYDQVIKNRN